MASVKLIDFGLSQEMKEHEHIKDSAGTMWVNTPNISQTNNHDLWLKLYVC
jgi:hypothetical protein